MSGFGFASTAEEVTEGLDLQRRTYVVTGVNSGLGLETARVLALRGGHVVGLARTLDKAADALRELGIEGTPIACELEDLASVRRAVEAVRGLPALDAIVANAGIMALPTLQQLHGIERQLYTNHVGHHVLVTGLLDRLADAGRVVMLSSGAHFYAREHGLELDNLSGAERPYDPWRMYGRSKLANILFARAVAKRLGAGKVSNAVHPGVIQTNLARHIPNAETMFESMRARMKTVGQGAATQCLAAVHPSVARTTGAYFSDCAVAEALPVAYDDALAEELWERTEAIAASA
ncbi:MAG: SDR family NAD(P)-dependent oxidoreductase [Alphaproteobacteria bacterium]|nr:SDR family NAD(P)-dependent oxidoreductase [Alphaproteobacteria bacterium]